MTGKPDPYRSRLSRLKRSVSGEGLEGLLLLAANNVSYAVGFFHIPSERPIGVYVPVTGDPVLFVPRLEEDHARQGWVEDIRTYPEYPGLVHPVVWMCRLIPPGKLGIDHLSYRTFLRIRPEREDIVLSSTVCRMRQCKDAHEIEDMAEAASFADLAVSTARRVIEASVANGVSEREILNETRAIVMAKMRAALSESDGVAPLGCLGTVHSGERAAFPHGLTSERQVRPGDAVIVGFGARANGYYAESGCTFFVGEARSEQQEWFRLAMLTRETVKERIKPGVSCRAVNRWGLDVIRQAGLGRYLRHRLGHGIGLQNHEPPWIEAGDETILVPGMVVTNEPGIYVPGSGGLRIIDTFLVTERGNRLLSHYLQDMEPDDRVISV